MKKNYFTLAAIIVSLFCYGQTTTLNDFEGTNDNLTSKNGAKFSFATRSNANQNSDLVINDFEPNYPNTPARFGASVEVVANPLKNDINPTNNVLKVGRTSTNWFELIAFPVETYTVPANAIRYLAVTIKYDAQPDIVIRIDGKDENANGDPTVAIRPINAYTDLGNWQTVYFPLEGGANGIDINAIVFFTDAGFSNNPKGYVLNNTDKFGYIDEFTITEGDNSSNTEEEYLTFLKEELQKEWPANRTINIVFHGHSIPSGYFQAPTVKTIESYPHQVLLQLIEKYPTAVINTIKTSIGGEYSVRGAERFDEDVLVHKPDVLLIDYSMNDRNQGLDGPYAAWDEMIKKAKTRGIKVLLLTSSPYRDLDMQSTETELYKHQQQVIKLAQENNVGIVDSFEVFKQKVLEGNNVNDYLSSFNHPNEIGHRLIAEEIMKYF